MRGTQFLDGETRTTGWRPTCECYGTELLPEYPDEPENKEDREYIFACDAVTLKRNRLLKEWQELPSDPCTVLDQFGGSGTTAAVAIELGRKAILCELNPEYIPMIESRTRVTAGLPLA